MEELLVFFSLLFIAFAGTGVVALIIVLQLRHRVARLEASLWDLRLRLPSPEVQAATAFPPTPAPQTPHETHAAPATAVKETPPLIAVPSRPVPAPGAASSLAGRPDAVASIQRPSPAQIPIAGPAPVAVAEDQLTSVERMVGTRWLNWVGALVLLVGIAFLLKFLYERGWIGPAGRVAIGMGFGVGLLLLGEVRLRRLHDLLSQSVSAAGCGALFLTTFLSFKFYEFSGRTETFALLCWFAAFTVALAVIRSARILAFLGLLGAYLTPYLLSTGQDQAEVLFAYLAVLALAAVGVQASRGWQGIPSLCLALSVLYYAGWYSRFYTPERLAIAATGAAGLIVFLSVVALARGLWNRVPVHIEECLVLLAAAVLGLGYLWQILVVKHDQILGFVLCGVALAAIAGLRLVRYRSASTRILENLFLALAAGSVLLVIPACLEADGAMLAWALGAVVLADMGAHSRHFPLELAAAVCLVASLWVGATQEVAHTGVFIPIVNRIFLAWFCAILAWFIAGWRYSRAYPADCEQGKAAIGLQVASSFMLVALLTYEAQAWFREEIRLPGSDARSLADWRTVTLSLLWALYPLSWLRWAGLRPKLWTLSAVHYFVLSFAWLTLFTSFHSREAVVFLNPIFVAALLLPAGILWVSRRIVGKNSVGQSGLQIYAHILCVALMSVELYQGLFLSGLSPTNRDWIRMALISAAWAAYATFVLCIGIARNMPAWRWLALGLLGLTLLKVFLLDMAEVRQIWRVLSFMVLGVLLMACSYAYSRHERQKRMAGQLSSGTVKR